MRNTPTTCGRGIKLKQFDVGDHRRPSSSLSETGQHHVSGEGEDSVSSPEPRLDDKEGGGRSRRRTKRIRTCFRREQLRALESYFAQKHNPDGKDWTCLAHKTGLPKRVLQVWFQNARAKLRRSLNSEYPQVHSPATPFPTVAVATSSSPPACAMSDHTQPFPTSTIDHLQLSLLTAPVNERSEVVNPSAHQLLQSSNSMDYNSQSAPGCSSLDLQGNFELEIDRSDSSDAFRLHYC
ncbi:LIM/homeobox protein ttx-3-like [Oryzias melastigma]|uniref:LIM/homeobox protein ttx-3-like n=1 Tax=Oryzias melastigma TaxID=30732 RepID=UPI00168D05C3|nr:LIM/homeobox protein ttx-3-like [Oryzias melastigma]